MKEVTRDEVTHRKQNEKLIDELVNSVIMHHASKVLRTRIAEILYKHIPTLDQACYERGCPCIDQFEEEEEEEMTESRAYITEDLWFPCDTCGKQITHHTMHDCFVMNPDILPTLEEWKLICKMVKQQQAEIEKLKVILFELKNASLDLCKIVEKASEK